MEIDAYISNLITIVGPAAKLRTLAWELVEKYGCYHVDFDGRRIICMEVTDGMQGPTLIAYLTEDHRVTVGHVWWTEDAEFHGCGIYVLGTTEFEWWGEGMTLVDEDDYDCWEDAVAAEAQHQHGPIVESFLSLAEPGTG